MRFLPEKPRRLLAVVGVLVVVVAGETWYRHWSPTHSLDTAHYANDLRRVATLEPLAPPLLLPALKRRYARILSGACSWVETHGSSHAVAMRLPARELRPLKPS